MYDIVYLYWCPIVSLKEILCTCSYIIIFIQRRIIILYFVLFY